MSYADPDTGLKECWNCGRRGKIDSGCPYKSPVGCTMYRRDKGFHVVTYIDWEMAYRFGDLWNRSGWIERRSFLCTP